MAVSFIAATDAECSRAVARLLRGNSDDWLPSDFREIMRAVASDLASGIFELSGAGSAIVAVEAEEVDDLGKGFVEHLEEGGVSCHLACFWMRRRVIRDEDRRATTIVATSSQQYLDESKGVQTLIVLQPVAARPEFVEYVVKKFKYVNDITRVVMVAPIMHPHTLMPTFAIIRQECGLEPDVIAFQRVDEETKLLQRTRYGSESLLYTSRSDLKKRSIPDFAAYRMDNRAQPKLQAMNVPGLTLGGSDEET